MSSIKNSAVEMVKSIKNGEITSVELVNYLESLVEKYPITSIEDGGLKISLSGWGFGLSNDDYIVLKNGGDTTRYKLDSGEYASNPSDMWIAEASFSPREH